MSFICSSKDETVRVFSKQSGRARPPMETTQHVGKFCRGSHGGMLISLKGRTKRGSEHLRRPLHGSLVSAFGVRICPLMMSIRQIGRGRPSHARKFGINHHGKGFPTDRCGKRRLVVGGLCDWYPAFRVVWGGIVGKRGGLMQGSFVPSD